MDLGSPLTHAEASLIADKYRAMQGSARRGRLGESSSSSSSSSAESIRTFKGNAVRGKYRNVTYCTVLYDQVEVHATMFNVMSCHVMSCDITAAAAIS